MWLFLAIANVSTWKVTKGKLIYFIHIAMANDFMYGVPPRHTHGENGVNRPIFWPWLVQLGSCNFKFFTNKKRGVPCYLRVCTQTMWTKWGGLKVGQISGANIHYCPRKVVSKMAMWKKYKTKRQSCWRKHT